MSCTSFWMLVSFSCCASPWMIEWMGSLRLLFKLFELCWWFLEMRYNRDKNGALKYQGPYSSFWACPRGEALPGRAENGMEARPSSPKNPKAQSLALLLCVGRSTHCFCTHFLALPLLPTPSSFLWQELLDSTFSWYLGALVFPLMPSQQDKEDEDEDEEPSGEKAKKKSPEEGNRPPSDLAQHDVIQVKMLGQLHLSHDLQGTHMSDKRGHQGLGPTAFGSAFISLTSRGFWPPACCLGCAMC